MLAAELFDSESNKYLWMEKSTKTLGIIPNFENQTPLMVLAHELGHVFHSIFFGNGGPENYAEGFRYNVLFSLGLNSEWDAFIEDYYIFNLTNPGIYKQGKKK